MRHKTFLIAMAALAFCGVVVYADYRNNAWAPLGAVPVTGAPAAAAAEAASADADYLYTAIASRPGEDPRFARALSLYRAGRWPAAYGRFMVLADEGHPQAALIALQMLKHGPSLYDSAWSAAPSQVASWEQTLGASAAIQLVAAGE